MSDPEAASPVQDLSKTIWNWPEWIEALGPLNEKNVLSYFGHSPFYDKQSSNEILKMQRIHTGQEQEDGDEEEDLRKFTGAEFALVHARAPGLFIIHKRERFNEMEASPIAAYFIVNNDIYQSQDLHSLLSTRLSVAVTSIQSSLQLLHSTLTTASPFNPRSESQFVLSSTSKTAPPSTTLLEPSSQPTANPTGAVDSPAPGTPSVGTNAAASSSKRTQPESASNPPSHSLLLALRTTLTSLPTLLTSSSTAPAPPPTNPSSSHYPSNHIGGGSLGGRTPGGATPSAGTPSFLNSYTDSRRNTPASTGPGGMVPTPPPSSKNRGSPEEGGGGGGGGKKKRRKGGAGGNANAASGSGQGGAGAGATPGGQSQGGGGTPAS
ncbi:MED6 mediator subfamily complex component-domain-containing protein [Mrakia frigida]|uniref:mediator complex subunit MED6 n=1 Tax=Mrakia frigida TaxID=29902 RepID=UPI003FCBFA32